MHRGKSPETREQKAMEIPTDIIMYLYVERSTGDEQFQMPPRRNCRECTAESHGDVELNTQVPTKTMRIFRGVVAVECSF